jgi:hypothetical protein
MVSKIVKRIVSFLKRRYILTSFAVLTLVFVSIQPTNTANWSLDQKILPSAKISNNLVTIENVRNFTYRSTSDYTPNYYTRDYDLSKIKSVDYIVEPFGDFSGAAHTFLSFGFEGGQYVAISIEIRKKVGQSFSPWKGLFKQYALVYVVADEQDVVKLRSNYRKDDVYVYPTKIDQEHAKKLFLSMIARVNKLHDKPEFYNTITNTCTTNIVRHVNEIGDVKVPLSYKVLMPGYSDKLAYDLGLLDTTLPYDKIREKYKVNEKAMKYADDKDFSIKIRE